MYHKILLATDLADTSKVVAKKAADLANHFDAKLYVIHVIEAIPSYGYPGVTDVTSPYIDKANKAVQELTKDLLAPVAKNFIIVGKPKSEILKKIEELEIDLVVVGSHSEFKITRILGSVANGVLHSAPCDVVTVRIQS